MITICDLFNVVFSFTKLWEKIEKAACYHLTSANSVFERSTHRTNYRFVQSGSSLLIPGCFMRQENLLHLSLSSPRATDGHWRLTLPWLFYLNLISKFWKPLLMIYPRGLIPVVALIGGPLERGTFFKVQVYKTVGISPG